LRQGVERNIINLSGRKDEKGKHSKKNDRTRRWWIGEEGKKFLFMYLQ
jgi:hypothetical protein